MNRKQRRKMSMLLLDPTRVIPSEYDRLSLYEKRAITLQSGKGLENRYRVAAVGSDKTLSDDKTRARNGWQVRKVVMSISKMSTRKDTTSCFYTPGVVRNTHAQEAYLWAKKPRSEGKC